MCTLEHDTRDTSIKSAEKALHFLWPEFALENGMVVLAKHAGSNSCPSGTLTDWETFINHTHVFDEFGGASQAVRQTVVSHTEHFDEIEVIYDELHPDFITACELGRMAAKLWSLKLNLDFPDERFRVYYTQYDNPIVRFHMVRSNEPLWLTDEDVRTARSDLRNSLVYDSRTPEFPVSVSSPH
jgi:hypothetical protein